EPQLEARAIAHARDVAREVQRLEVDRESEPREVRDSERPEIEPPQLGEVAREDRQCDVRRAREGARDRQAEGLRDGGLERRVRDLGPGIDEWLDAVARRRSGQ